MNTMLKNWIRKWKLVDSSQNWIIPKKGMIFVMSEAEMERADKIYKEQGNIEYTFYPCGGIGWGTKVKVWKTNEYIDITDVENW